MTDAVTIDQLKPGHEYPGGSINSRKDYSRDSIDSRKESIIAFGLLQSLLVCPAPNKTHAPFYVCGGGLRYIAIGELVSEKRLPKDYGIAVTVRPDFDSAMALAASIEENREVLPTHPAAVYEQFAVLRERGRSPEDIAKLYGMKAKQVDGILALGSLHPEIRYAWREGRIKAEIAETFTLEPDQKRQLAVFKKLSKGGHMWRDEVRRELVGKGDDCGALINFIGKDVYEAAGGKVMVDLFQADHGVSDPALAKRLADEKMQTVMDGLVAEGWAWAKAPDELPQGWDWQWPKIEIKPKFEPAEQERFAELAKRHKALQDSEDDAGFDDTGQDEWERLDVEKAAIEAAARARAFRPEQKAKSGVVVSLGDDGNVSLQCGIIRPSDVKSVPDKDLSARDKKKKKKAVAGLSNALNQRLSETLTVAAGETLSQQPMIATRAIAAGVAAEGDVVVVTEKGLAKQKRGGFPHAASFANTFEAMMKAGNDEIGKALAKIAGAALDFQELSGQSAMKEKGVAALCNALDPKLLNAALRQRFDAKDYFGGISAAMRVQAIREACGDDPAARAAKLKKDEQTKFATANVPKTGWLPLELRTAHYDGPSAAKKATVANLAPKAKKQAKAAKPQRKAA